MVKTGIRRVLSALLVIALVLPISPIAVRAEGTGEDQTFQEASSLLQDAGVVFDDDGHDIGGCYIQEDVTTSREIDEDADEAETFNEAVDDAETFDEAVDDAETFDEAVDNAETLDKEVSIPVTRVYLERDELTAKLGDAKVTLNAVVEPENASNVGLQWESSKPEVASVDQGVVTFHDFGTCEITVITADGQYRATCIVTVEANDEVLAVESSGDELVGVTGVALNTKKLDMLVGGQTETLTVEVMPSNASDTTVIWASSDPSVATVENGIVTAVGMGVASISAKSANEACEDACEVTVWNSCGDDAKWRVENTSTLIIAGNGAISDCKSAMQQPWKAFKSKITTVQIGSGITAIGKNAFAMFSKLENLQILENSALTEILMNAFMGTSKLKEVYLPNSLTKIGDTNISSKDIHFAGTASEWEVLNYTGKKKVYVLDETGQEVEYKADPYSGKCGANATWNFDLETGVLTVSGSGQMSDYTSASGAPWYALKSQIKKIVISDSVESVGNNAFREYPNLTGVILASTVTKIGKYSFATNVELSEIDLAKVKTIGDNAFLECSGITSLNLPDADSIGESAFLKCTGLENVTLGSAEHCVTKIGKRAFNICTNLKSIDLSHVDEVGEFSFEGSNLESVNLDGVKTIGQYAFNKSAELKVITMGDGLVSIGQSAFFQTAVESAKIPGTVKELGIYIFSDCKRLKNVSVDEGITFLPEGCFCDDIALEKVSLPVTINLVGNSAFSQCNKLNQVDYPGTKQQWKLVSVGEMNEPLTELMGKHLVAVTGVSLDKTELKMTLGGKTELLVATVLPENADNKEVTWKSDNEKVASVDQSGKVTAVGEGTAKITATTMDNGFTAICEITVVNPEPEIDLSTFVFTLSNPAMSDERFQYTDLPITKQDDGTFVLSAPTYVIGDYQNQAQITVKAPKEMGKTYTVSYTAYASDSGESLGTKNVSSINGQVVLDGYYNRKGKPDFTKYDPETGFFKNPEYSDFTFNVEGSDYTYRVCLSLYNDLKKISVTNKSETVEPERVINKVSDGRYEVVLTRGTTYKISAYGGIQETNFTKSISYFTKGNTTGETAKSIEYTPGDEVDTDFTVRITNEEPTYNIEDRTYKLHVVVEDPPEEKVEFEAYQFFVNGEEIQVTYNEKLKAWVIPQLTQYDKFSFKAAVKNTDDTAVYEWTRGMGLNKAVIDGAITNEVNVDTSSVSALTYIIDGKVTCKGQTISLPRIRVSKITPLKLKEPEILQQPVGGTAFVGAENPISVVIKKPDGGVPRFLWYECEDSEGTNGKPIEGSGAWKSEESGIRSTYTPDSTTVGTRWYYCEIYLTYQGIVGEKVKSTCAECTVKALEWPLKGEGSEKNPYIIVTADDLEAIRSSVAKGNSFAGVYFQFANDVTLPDGWTPIGCTKDGSDKIDAGNNLNAFSGNIDGNDKTLTVPVDGLPLLGYVKNASIKDLSIYGERIAGYGLVNNCQGVGLSGSCIVIDHVTLKSGTKTLKSGLIGSVLSSENGFAGCSAGFMTTIRNCVVESGVVIGYTGTENEIGSFAGKLQGTIENCVSSATVRGVNYVGGLVGAKDNALGACEITNSAFHGNVEGDSYVGGVAGGPYWGAAAPNAYRLTIAGCKVDGIVSGKKYVGGIIGGDTKVAQVWNSYSIIGNTFSGTASGNEYVGGIIGYYESLNKFDNIQSNAYSVGGDVKSGIGFVHYLDTNYKNPTHPNGTLVFNTETDVSGAPAVNGCDWQKKHNRTDDPLGKDADKLARAIGGDAEPICYKLVASGQYKTQYSVGEDLNLNGIKLTAYWTGGKVSQVDLSDVEISGYDKNESGKQTVFLAYKAATCEISIVVIPKSTKITVSVTIKGDSKHGASGGVHGLAMGGLSLWASEPNMEADTSETVWDVLKRVFSKYSMSVDASDKNQYNTIYIASINGLGEFDNGNLSGWMYTVNGSHPDVGVSARYLKQGDEIILHYTDDYTKEEGGMTPVEKPGTAQKVIDLINKIGTVTYTDACKQRIDAARSAYDALTDAEKSKVSNYSTLTKAEAEYKRLMQAGATDVDNLISKIGTVTANSGPAISNAWNAYNALTAEQKALVKKFNTLQEATQKWNQLKADEVVKLIDKIEEPVTEKSKASIEAARKAFDGLTDAQKRLVTNTKKLTDAEKAYAQLTATPEDKEKAQKVIDLIKKLTNVTLDSEKDIQAARKAYDALTDLQKPLVDNYDVLTTAETKLAMLKAMGKVSDPYISTGDYMEKLGTPGIGSIGGEWMVIGLARSGRTVPGVEDYYKKALEYIESSIDPETGRLHKAKSTDNSRMILALTALGRDVTNVGGHNLLAGLSDLEYVKYQGNNGPIWALLALDSGNYPVPSGGTVTRQALIDEILRVQTSDGGWTVSGDKADSDMTGMALTALAPYYTKDLKVQEAIDKAIARLSEMQDEDGGYSTSYDGTTKIATSESISQVVTALSALGINADTDPRFVKNGNSVIDALLRYYVKGGGFKHVMNGEIDGMGTEQAYYALTAYYRFLSGKTNLYDMTDIINMGGDPVELTTEPTVPTTTEPAQVEQTKASYPWWILVICIFGGCGWGVAIMLIIPKLNKKKD